MNTKVVLMRVREGKLAMWKAWCTELAGSLREEATVTLAEEKVLEEMCLLFTLNGESYVIGFADSEGETLPANMTREINQKHKAMKQECLEYVSDGETLYHFFSK